MNAHHLLFCAFLATSGCDPAEAATVPPPNAERANDYDQGWHAAWVQHCRSIFRSGGKRDGFVLQIGDSMTHSYAYALWAAHGTGRTTSDLAIAAWMHAGAWGSGNGDASSIDGWYLAAADTTGERGMTSGGGMGAGELLSGGGVDGPTMPAVNDRDAARATLADPTYTGNIRLATLIAAFADAQFAVVMLNLNDATHPSDVTATAAVLDALEAAHIVPILSTIPPRSAPGYLALTQQYNQALADLARSRGLPLIDFCQEILLRRPDGSWDGTLIGANDVHPTGSGGGYDAGSDPYLPGGDPATLTTGDACLNVGYLLRCWLTLQKLKQVKAEVVDGADPPPTTPVSTPGQPDGSRRCGVGGAWTALSLVTLTLSRSLWRRR
jgi:hypothetical protein